MLDHTIELLRDALDDDLAINDWRGADVPESGEGTSFRQALAILEAAKGVDRERAEWFLAHSATNVPEDIRALLESLPKDKT